MWDVGGFYPTDSGTVEPHPVVIPPKWNPTEHTYVRDVDSLTVRILVWQRLRLGGYMRRAFLASAEYKDTAGMDSWALICMEAWDDSESRWSVSGGMEHRPFKRYDHRPTNVEVYNFLDSLRAVESRMFVYDAKGHYDWSGVDVQFIEGSVCEENWEDTIGEKPTKFFPRMRK